MILCIHLCVCARVQRNSYTQPALSFLASTPFCSLHHPRVSRICVHIFIYTCRRMYDDDDMLVQEGVGKRPGRRATSKKMH